MAKTISDCEFVATSTVIADCLDPTDNRLLELAVDGRATVVVTGDVDLLTLNPFREIPILTARDFLLRFAPK